VVYCNYGPDVDGSNVDVIVLLSLIHLLHHRQFVSATVTVAG